jgi:hypothetical protein
VHRSSLAPSLQIGIGAALTVLPHLLLATALLLDGQVFAVPYVLASLAFTGWLGWAVKRSETAGGSLAIAAPVGLAVVEGLGKGWAICALTFPLLSLGPRSGLYALPLLVVLAFVLALVYLQVSYLFIGLRAHHLRSRGAQDPPPRTF